MQALVSLLPRSYEDQVFALWDELEAKFGLKYIRVTPFPHFTWQLGESYNQHELVPLLNNLTQKLEPFEVSTSGVHSFTGPAPVVYIKLEKDPGLVRLHSILWNQMQDFTTLPDKLYSPFLWQPHITLALQDISWDQQPEVMALLTQKQIQWRFTVDNFAVLCQMANGEASIEYRFKFGQGLVDFDACC